MKRYLAYFLATTIFIAYGCQKYSTQESRKNEAFFSSKNEAAESANRFMRLNVQSITSASITNISYIHSANKSLAFVFYKTNEGPKNIVITRTYTANGAIERESASTCDGTCGCQVQAVIDNQGNVKVGCSCANCALVTQ